MGAVHKHKHLYAGFRRCEQRFAVHDSVLLPIDKKGNFKSTGDRGESFWAGLDRAVRNRSERRHLKVGKAIALESKIRKASWHLCFCAR